MDRKSMGRTVAIGSVWIALLTISAQVQACRFFDCFRKNPAPSTVLVPTTTVPVASTGTIAVPAPNAVAASAAPTGACGAAQCEQTVLRFAPQVAYRTEWQPVPVTTYRRTVSTNPTTGLPITCTQPCTTYTYQARRVPYTTFRPFYATEPVASPAATVPTALPTTVAPGTVAAPCNTCAPSASWAYPPQTTPTFNSAPATVGTASPWTSASPSTPWASTTSSPADVNGATPWEPVQPGAGSGVAPNGAVQPQSDFPRGSTDPADQVPRISPSIDPNLNSSSSGQTAAGDTAVANGFGTSTRGDAHDPSYVNGVDRSAGTPASTTPWTTVRPEFPPPPSFPAGTGPTGAAGAAGSHGQGYPPPPSWEPVPYTVRPLPSTNAPVNNSWDNDIKAPPLLNDPRDRTAVRPIPARPVQQPGLTEPIPTRWASKRIEWPDQRTGHAVELAPKRDDHRLPVEAPRRLEPQRIETKRIDAGTAEPSRPVDQSGWRSARR